MSDARWIEIDKAIASVVGNFQRGVEFTHHLSFQTDDLIGSALRMGFMHAIQAGHTSLENALLRVLDLLGEARPSGESWHADLIARVGLALAGRPAILPPDLAAAADETRRFRNRAARAYDNFDPTKVTPAIDAADKLASDLHPLSRPSVRRPTPDHAACFASIPCATNVSAICTAFSAAPLRRLSDTHQNESPCGTVGSLRMRLTYTASSPAHSSGVT